MATPERSEPPARGAVAQKILDGGREPDPRFTLANERTFLAWIRTSLALLAGGIAVEAFTGTVFDDVTRLWLATGLLLLALLLSASAGFRWLRVERAMRHGKPLPLPVLVPILATGGAVVAVVLVVFLLLNRF
ncbi:YidH family protein [Citricoccus parietis]|uniref:YidH family protein n=2 Tax=Citricoccus parietis TaxID=592307 RepID=A0ABV5G521_9MICC